MIKNSRHLIYGLQAAFLAAVVAAAGCAGHAEAPEAYQGVIELEERLIGFEIGGRVADLAVTRGQSVTKGARLAALDDSLARPQRDARAAELRVAEAQVALLRAGSRAEEVRAQAAVVEGIRARIAQIEKNLERARQLASRGAAGIAPVDDLESDLRRAKADEAAAVERLRILKQGARIEEMAAAEARAQGAAAALAAEDQRLAHHVVVADADAVVVDTHVESGEIVPAGAPVVTLADTRHPFADVYVPQGDLAGIRVGVPARVRVDGEPQPFPGHVEEISRRTEFTPRYLFSERERPNLVVRVRVRIDDPDQRLHAGVPAFATIERAPAPRAPEARP